ncbi:class I SAM-dependent methyltransferase [Mangrovimicrobium sediminis]|uniref:Class I SAM-dependent methyltransferase n=1 Tax=Mangrovimicrobium sediminis TaxID=2562682 RepID=A0A4Z0M4F9_9GAMM|nr:class I SAM-dependent methyltransferase [Haliea sp. SAOS-164]TGD74317.1 class I SAM-dependent methyltransferase [Haliea sp. SAOS-164]
MLFNCPLGEEKARALVEVLDLAPGSRVLDIGCGDGEFLRRVHARWGGDCLGIDLDDAAIARASAVSGDAGPRFEVGDAGKLPVAAELDLAICIGSTHAFGSGRQAFAGALAAMPRMLRPGGQLLLGEGYWQRDPEQAYLDFIGEPVGVYNSHEENLQQAEAAGLVPLYAATSTREEWDHFEWCFRLRAERAARAAPQDEAAVARRDRVRQWNHFYRAYGCSTMGFGFYLFTQS